MRLNNAKSITQTPADVAFDLGAAAHEGGFSRKENPYDKESERDEFDAWNNDRDHEKNYYEGEL